MPGILKGLGIAGITVAVIAFVDDVAAVAFAATTTATNKKVFRDRSCAVRFGASRPPQFASRWARGFGKRLPNQSHPRHPEPQWVSPED
jgi:hypothetical protein